MDDVCDPLAAAESLWGALPMQDGVEVQSADGQPWALGRLDSGFAFCPEVTTHRTLPDQCRRHHSSVGASRARSESRPLTLGKDAAVAPLGLCGGGQPCPADINGDGQGGQQW
jgi:hypothetical protein